MSDHPTKPDLDAIRATLNQVTTASFLQLNAADTQTLVAIPLRLLGYIERLEAERDELRRELAGMQEANDETDS